MIKFLYVLFFDLLLMQTNFAQWFPQSSGTTVDLKSVYFIDSNTGWVAGYNGLILNTTDGGTSWTHQNSGIT